MFKEKNHQYLKFDSIMVDTLNLQYRLKDSAMTQSAVGGKHIYKDLAKAYIEFMEDLEKNHLKDGGQIYLLFDNAPTKVGMNNLFKNARQQVYSKYKAGRTKESKEFYNTLSLIKYYYLCNTDNYHTWQMQGYEADDLVKPLIDFKEDLGTYLMVTNDADWTRYLSPQAYWMPHLYHLQNAEEFLSIKGYVPTENNVLIYKSVFGDSADGIPSLITENIPNKKHMLEILAEGKDIEEVIQDARLTKNRDNPVYKTIQDEQIQFKINRQLIASKPVDKRLMDHTLTTGRDSKSVRDAVETALGMKDKENHFVFGNISKGK